MNNLLTDPAPEQPASAAWRFTGAPDGNAKGRVAQDADGAALVIEHADYAEGSRWEKVVTGLPAGTLLLFAARVHSRWHEGQWGRKMGKNASGQDFFQCGNKLALEALDDQGVVLEAVANVFPYPTDPRGMILGEGTTEATLEMVVPEGTAAIRAHAELSGAGTASFSGLILTGEPMDPDRLNDRLVDRMKAAGDVYSPTVESAFRSVPRHHFLPGQNWGTAYRDDAIVTHLADGSEEAISSSSQPTMMAIMLEQLQVERGMRVLEIGAGTGYNAALLSKLTGDPALVWTVDLAEEFCAEARAHLREAGIEGVHVESADGWEGWPEAAPYDRVIVTASAHDIAPAWMDQLKGGGRLIVPWGTSGGVQRCLFFRRDGGRLVMVGQTTCGFMRMRGASEMLPGSVAPEAGSDWIFPGQPAGDPASLVAYPAGTAPAPGAGEHLVHRRWFDYVAAWGDPPQPD